MSHLCPLSICRFANLAQWIQSGGGSFPGTDTFCSGQWALMQCASGSCHLQLLFFLSSSRSVVLREVLWKLEGTSMVVSMTGKHHRHLLSRGTDADILQRTRHMVTTTSCPVSLPQDYEVAPGMDAGGNSTYCSETGA